MLDECDIDRLLNFYHANTSTDEAPQHVEPVEGGIVYRDGKPYKKVTAAAPWASQIF